MCLDPRRNFLIQAGEAGRGPVVYWMSREQRFHDNWGLLVAQDRAMVRGVPLVIAFTLVDSFSGATLRQYHMMLEGVEHVAQAAREYGVGFVVLQGNPASELGQFLASTDAAELICDFDPLRIKRQWLHDLCQQCQLPITEVDGHNIVPCRIVSPKREYGAYTLRPKLRRLLDEFLTDFPAMKQHPYRWSNDQVLFNGQEQLRLLSLDRSVSPVSGVEGGEDAAQYALENFLDARLERYDANRNNPLLDGQSGLSPWLHFGQLSPQRVALQVRSLVQHYPASVDAFLEELVVRRELSDNFCHHCHRYDTIDAAPDWSRTTIEAHRHDPRFPCYDRQTFESFQTADRLWNAAQRQLVESGRMHGYLRMYWAKKILEWSPTPENAIEIAVYLNDRYALDGRDPNGYAGIAWSLLGVHDRAWGRRPVFGTIRFMSFDGCRRKFDVAAFCARWGV